MAPILRFDRDPYLVVIDGRLQWIIDAYTVSDRIPCAQPIDQQQERGEAWNPARREETLSTGTNYIRNSVKVQVDANDGSTKSFVVDEDDPVLNTYRRIFPQRFVPTADTPETVRAHFRYPEDLWSLPKQTYEGDEGPMKPYYVIMRLPGEERLGFILIQPFTPANKDNMTVWMAARSNGEQYGELVIPIEQSLLYVEPVYLRAERGELPELKRVIVVHDQSVVMEPTLEQAMAVLFRGSPEVRADEGAAAPEGGAMLGRDTRLPASSAVDTFRRSQVALRQGNWTDYGRLQRELEGILQRLAE